MNLWSTQNILTLYRDTWYKVRCLFSPFNTVKCAKLPKSWADRDTLMFHSMFQILVDFVEEEQPFISWDDSRKLNVKKHVDYAEMVKWNDEKYGPAGYSSFYCDWFTDEEKRKTDLRTLHQYQVQKEILYLYKWYKDEKYEQDKWALHEATGQKIKLTSSGIARVPNGKPALITWGELHEAEDEHRIVCNRMLQRILVVREYLWT